MFMAMAQPPSLVHSHILFSIDGPYCIDPQFKCEAPEGSREHINFVPTLLVDFECQHPVFFLQINHPDSLHDDSKRKEADDQMRRRFRDLAPALTIPTLHGVCAFGTHLAFYEYDLATHGIQPPPHVTTGVAPISRWDLDVLRPEGANYMRDIIKRSSRGLRICRPRLRVPVYKRN